MNSLRENKSGGPDVLPPWLLKIIKEEICTPLPIDYYISEGYIETVHCTAQRHIYFHLKS